MSADNPYAAPKATDGSHLKTDGRCSQMILVAYPRKILAGIIGIVVLMPHSLSGFLNLCHFPIIACFRLKNVGYHPALGMLVLVPVANIWVGILCAPLPQLAIATRRNSTAGKNHYR